jgi:alcohol dehydrogenase (cytochrome c)
MKNRNLYIAVVTLAFGGAAVVSILTAQQRPASPFNQAQADAGKALYEAACSSCHMPNLSGSGDASPLAGNIFMANWGARTAGQLHSFIATSMPPQRPGSLSAAEYLSISAYILNYNGGTPGAQALAANNATAIGMFATGQQLAAADGKGKGKGAPAGGRGVVAAAPAKGITHAGEVKNYRNVTDAMLKAPPANDWLMIRGNYSAHNFSTLNQITTENVKGLQLIWSWTMNNGGTNQPAPLVHDGVLYVNNTGNILQALDAKTGDLIWENNYGNNANAAAMRGISIYQDKIILSTSDAHIRAFDARTGKDLWDTTIGDRTGGNYSTSSGPLAIGNNTVIQGLGGCQVYRDEKCFLWILIIIN